MYDVELFVIDWFYWISKKWNWWYLVSDFGLLECWRNVGMGWLFDCGDGSEIMLEMFLLRKGVLSCGLGVVDDYIFVCFGGWICWYENIGLVGIIWLNLFFNIFCFKREIFFWIRYICLRYREWWV